jgi:hypothetical protein
MSLDIHNVYQIMAIRLGFNDAVRENLSTEAEKSPLLEAVTRERLAQTAGWKRFGVCCGDL